LQLGFVLDNTRCIGCHACTVACKSENDIPVGDFRTWVKYTEEGAWPEVSRSFTVLRCNQCTDAPCVTICPVTALDKRPDGIVDLDKDICVGCKACMQACPYDSIFLDERTGTASKCHFCAHRTEVGLAPACAVVCPTEAIIPGDFDDPNSVVSGMAASLDLSVRKAEAGTSPNVFYRDAALSGIDPELTNGAGGYLWAQRLAGPGLDAELFDAAEAKAGARTTYSVDRQPLWGSKITGYLFFKSLAAGVFLAGAGALLAEDAGAMVAVGVPLLSLVFLSLTLALLVTDLKRPERFLSMLLRPNFKSWLAVGSFILTAYAGLLTAWLGVGVFGGSMPLATLVLGITCALAVMSAIYTAWLFGQAKGRVLWMKRGFAWHLLFQALLAGSAALVLIEGIAGPLGNHEWLSPPVLLAGALLAHLGMTLLETRLAPLGREPEYHRVARLVTSGPFARRHWLFGVLVGVGIPLLLLLVGDGGATAALAGFWALWGLWVEEDVLIRAGQALPIS